MGSIIGEKKKWHNAISDDIAAIDSQISTKTALLNQALADQTWATQSLVTCNNLKFLQTCRGATGRTKTQWQDLFDRNLAPITLYRADIKSLQAQRATFVSQMDTLTQQAVDTTQAKIIQAQANKAVAAADTATAGATIAKVGTYALIGGVIIAVILGGIFIYKKVKKH